MERGEVDETHPREDVTLGRSEPTSRTPSKSSGEGIDGRVPPSIPLHVPAGALGADRDGFGFKPGRFGFEPGSNPNRPERPGSKVDSEVLQSLPRCVLMGG